ncbi:MAG: LysR family transcriptional regulator [Acidobacteria bacterium]|nr:LysR family transcriptional regulator [Acidobacteriota bacterium]
MIDVLGLRALTAIATHGSVVAASAALGYTPSAVSQQVKKLEKQAGMPLLERQGRGVLLTQRGASLAARGVELLQNLEELEALVRSESGQPAGQLRISAFSTACRGLLGPALAHLAEQPERAGTLKTHVVAEDPPQALARVVNGGADLAIVHNWNSVPLPIPDSLSCIELGRDTADLIVRDDHPLATHLPLERTDLVSQRWISTPEGTICHEALLRIFSDLGRLPDIGFFDPDFSTHLALVSLGVGVAIVPRLGRPALPANVVALELDKPAQLRDVKLVFRRTMASSPAIALMHAEIAHIAQEILSPPREP